MGAVSYAQAVSASPPVSIMWKTVSEDCNLACDYCYYSTCGGKPGKTIRRIADPLLRKVIREVMQGTRGSASFAWQGGEPLLAGREFFERVVSYQASLARPNTVISNSIQTNGTLINAEWARFFRIYSFLIGVSLDGPQAIHDKRRVTASGTGSYNQVMRGIEELRKADVDFNILTVIHEGNVREAPVLMAWLEEQELRHVQFIPCMDFRSQQADAPGNYLITPEEYGTFLCEAFDRWYRDGNPVLSVRLFDNWLMKLVGLEPECCVQSSSCGGTLVLEQNGDVYPCDFYLDDRYCLGNASQDSLAECLHHPVYQAFAEQKGKLSPECKQCKFLSYCQGGCPRNRTSHTEGNMQPGQGRDYFCQSYYKLYAYGEERMLRLARNFLRKRKRIQVGP
ncbi:anaerobic sulfatase maturase [Paenibacillus kribbensis]|uniref:anaerobic sulfatase maturase n=1 Tax=Paenibacillus kribbensis TaxID=172713 RepID=UPI0008381084|nr:anaerobic sulfatase maturase [Paenibacillus kribbensis]